MRKNAIFATLVALAMIAPVTAGATEAIPGASGTIFVTERQLGSVAALDAASGEMLWTSPTGAAPIGVTKPHGTGRVYTSDEGSNRMSVFDERTGALIRTIPMGRRPHHLIASPTGAFIYVGEFGQSTVGVIDTGTDTEIAQYFASAYLTARTHAVWISNDGRSLYATNSVVNTISKLDASTGAMIWESSVLGNNPSEILVTQSGMMAYVSIRNDDKIRVFDVSGALPVAIGEAEAKSQPDTLSLTRDGKTLVVGLRASPTGRARAALIDTATLTTRYVEMPAHSTTGHQWLSANGRFTFMAVESPGAVAVIENASGTVVDEYPYPGGGTRPHGVFYEASRLAGGG